MARGWLTPNFPPEHRFYQRQLLIPATAEFLGLVNGALVELCLPHNWEQSGEMTPFEAADYFTVMWEQYTHNLDEPPDWETPDDLDGQPEQPWYEDLADWIIQGFLAVTFTPEAAIVYQATVPKLRVAFRTGNLGALFRVLINGVEVWTGDSYAPITDLIDNVFDMSAETEPYTVRIEHDGVGPNINGTEAKLEFIRQEVVANMVATILRGDPGGCGIQWSTNDGGTWNTIDLASCITGLANDAILQAIQDGIISPGSGTYPPAPSPETLDCITYHVKLAANGKWVLPTFVNSGDTVEIQNAQGGWNDGTFGWFCPDGSIYTFGECGGGGAAADEGDPLQTAYHMQIVAQIGEGDFIDPLTSGPASIPAGIVNQRLTFQANDGSLSDNAGELQFDVVWCPSASTCFDFADVFDDSAFHGWRAGNDSTDFNPDTWYGPNSSTWGLSYHGQAHIYGEGYNAGNFGIFAVKELGQSCTIHDAQVFNDGPDIGSVYITGLWLRVSGTWQANPAGSATIHGSPTLSAGDTANVDAIAITIYGDGALWFNEIDVNYL